MRKSGEKERGKRSRSEMNEWWRALSSAEN